MDQCDLFGEPLPPPEPEPVVELPLSPLAAPCAFRNRSNKPCQRLARKPIMVDGKELRSHGQLFLLCPIECFNGAAADEIASIAQAAE